MHKYVPLAVDVDNPNSQTVTPKPLLAPSLLSFNPKPLQPRMSFCFMDMMKYVQAP